MFLPVNNGFGFQKSVKYTQVRAQVTQRFDGIGEENLRFIRAQQCATIGFLKSHKSMIKRKMDHVCQIVAGN